MQSHSSCLADVTRYFVWLANVLMALKGKIDGEFLDHCFHMFDKRWKDFTAECEFVRLAFFLHPVYRQAAVSLDGGGRSADSKKRFWELYIKPVRLGCCLLTC